MSNIIDNSSNECKIYTEIGRRIKFISNLCAGNVICDDETLMCIGESAVEIVDLYNLLKEKNCINKLSFIVNKEN